MGSYDSSACQEFGQQALGDCGNGGLLWTKFTRWGYSSSRHSHALCDGLLQHFKVVELLFWRLSRLDQFQAADQHTLLVMNILFE